MIGFSAFSIHPFTGHYCPQGSHQELRCSSGTYQDQTGQDVCIECPTGYFCDNTIAPVVLFNNSICLQGKSTKNALEFQDRLILYHVFTVT